MKPLYFFLLVALTDPTLAQETTLVTPVFSQIVAARMPEGFRAIYEDATADSYILESIPRTETLETWTRMLTLTGTKGIGGREGAALGMANALADRYRSACPDHLETAALPAPEIPGAVEVFAAFLGCTTIPGSQPEAMVVLVMAANRDVYTLQWAERAASELSPVTYDLADWAPRLDQLTAGTRLCDIVPGEAAPYPSCTNN